MQLTLPQPDRPFVNIEAAAPNSTLEMLDRQQVEQLYRQHGALLFRGFELSLDSFSAFTDQFCSSYVRNESPGREILSADGRVQTVNTGFQHFPLHPEISREPWQPDIAWFACEQPSTDGGETTLCDGIAVANALPEKIQAQLRNSTLSHRIPTTLEWCADFLDNPGLQAEDLAAYSNPASYQFSIENGEVFRDYLRPMLHTPMFSEQLAYGNFLVFARRRLGVRYFPTYKDGSEVEDQLVDQIEALSNSLGYAHRWRKGDMLMLDNTRFMHGRNPIGDPQHRRIYTQFGYCSFVPPDYLNLAQQTWRDSP